jgi:dephospho-CoA kinase
MSAWPGKYVIGLTGNIATGKSVVRKMLEHLGALGIDADGLAHRAMAKGAPGHQAVVDTFGHWILGVDGQIERPRLGRLVFADADALARLEAIVHPLVRQAVGFLIRRTAHKIVVIEAIKLIESQIGTQCDSIWVTYAPQEIQLKRLIEKRKMRKPEAQMRIASQPSQDAKIAAADVVIRNDGSFEKTWSQVLDTWKKLVPSLETAPLKPVATPSGEMMVQRARPSHAHELATLVNRLSNGEKSVTRSDIMAAFGEKAYLVLEVSGKSAGLVGWQVENLVARTNEVYLDEGLPVAESIKVLMLEVERASSDLQCEASLVFLGPELAGRQDVWDELGYKPTTIDALSVRAWQDAAKESMPAGTVLFFKKLREDRVLRPV